MRPREMPDEVPIITFVFKGLSFPRAISPHQGFRPREFAEFGIHGIREAVPIIRLDTFDICPQLLKESKVLDGILDTSTSQSLN